MAENSRPAVPALHQKIFARAIATDKDTGRNWLALGLIDSGVLLLSDESEEAGVSVEAELVSYAGNGAAMFFALSAEERAAMHMSDAVYQELNVGLKMSEAKGKTAAGRQQPQQRGGAQGNRR